MKPIIIAAGGTGGHFFPAEALAAALLARGERVVLMTDARSSAVKSNVFAQCETFIIPGAGIAGRSLARVARGGWEIAKGVLTARKILAGLEPAVLVGFGGYPAVAPMLAARALKHRPVLILHDQNAVLGKANRLLSRFADTIALSFPHTTGMQAGQTTQLTGNPVRPAIAAQANAPYSAPAEQIRITVFGGSLGARIFASLIPGAMALLPPELRARIALTMQCPAGDIASANAALAACGMNATLAPFFDDVAGLMAASHLIIARSGGSTVAEIAVIGRPAIFIPLTINADQRANARAAEAAGGAMLVEQAAGPAALAGAIENLLATPGKLAAMAQASAASGIADAAEKLSQLVIQTTASVQP